MSADIVVITHVLFCRYSAELDRGYVQHFCKATKETGSIAINLLLYAVCGSIAINLLLYAVCGSIAIDLLLYAVCGHQPASLC